MDLPMPTEPAPLSTLPRSVPAPRRAAPARRVRTPGWPRLRAVLLGTLSIAIFLALWQAASATHLDFFLSFDNIPAPSDVAVRAMAIVLSPAFVGDVITSCERVYFGFAIAALLAVPTGLVIGRYKVAHELIFPLCELLRPVPAIAWVPISIMLWPTDWESIVFITFLGAFFPILLNTLYGVQRIDPVLVLAARSLGASEGAIFREVYLPGALPAIFAGLAVGMGVGWVSVIAAEMISGQSGIGYFTWQAYSLIQYSDIVLGMVAIGLLGLVSSAIIRGIGRAAMPWLPAL
ncbi:MAG: ABC transporter permease [Proteobacteria bacterium]|nr:ABC transporter permease [Pseudomonadota bacterium]